MKIIEIGILEFKEKIYEKYTKLFPDDEARSLESIKEIYEKESGKIFKIMNKDKIIGFIMLEKLKEEYPYYMDYFAIFEEYQGKGFGTKALKKLLEDVIKDKGLCLEIEKEDKNDIMKVKRAKFYRNLSFEKVNSEYLLFNVHYTPYIYSPKSKLTKKEIDKIMYDYYIANCGEKGFKENCTFIK